MTAARRHVGTLVLVISFVGAFTATHLPPSNLPSVEWISDKAEHFLTFAWLAAISHRRFRSYASSAFKKRNAGAFIQRFGPAFAVLAALAAYAAFDELTQPFVGRDCEALDWLADMVGAAAGVAVSIALSSVRRSARRAD